MRRQSATVCLVKSSPDPERDAKLERIEQVLVDLQNGGVRVMSDDTFSASADRHLAGVWWDMCSENVDGADQAEELVRELMERWTLSGDDGEPILGALTMWWGTPINGSRFRTGPLRVDMHAPSGRAAVCWLPSGEIGSESDFRHGGTSFKVMESSSKPPVEIPAERAMLSADAAILAIREYVSSGRQPMCVEWHS
jgi:hypothetical protein